MNGDRELEQRIRERAYKIWVDEGRPDGRERENWELAKFAIAHEDGLASALVPLVEPKSEPIQAVFNQGEFPTLVDQGEGQSPAYAVDDGVKSW
jgi:hypothetical protein